MEPIDPKELGRSKGPIYRRIAEAIGARIQSGELETGARLPPIRALASDLGVNRDTVALAYDELSAEGWVETAVGRGTFVRRGAIRERSAPRSLPLAPHVEDLLRLEGARPRFAAGTDLVALHALVPDPALYPAEAFRKALNKVLGSAGPELWTYGGAQGHPRLREVIARRLRRGGMDLEADELVLCHGATQGISLAVRLFAQPGDAVAVEDPTYGNVLSTLVALGVRAEPVRMEPEGPRLESIERVLARPDVKAFYTIPTFHNPLGTSTGLAHRRALLGVAQRSGKPIIEDAFEMDLRFEGSEVPSLAALDDEGLVVQLTSFSKSLFPAVRTGAIRARGRSLEALVALKHATDLSDSMPLQAALAEFIASGAYDRHLVKLRRELFKRRNALLAALEAHLPEGSTWTRPLGGYQLWAELPFDVDTRDLLADAARAGVSFAPGSQFLPDHRASRGMRLAVAQADASAIERGVAALGRVLRAHRGADPAARQAAGVHL